MQMVDSLWCQGCGKMLLPPAYEFHTRKLPDRHMLSDAPLRGSYAGHLPTHHRGFGTCLPANNHTFLPGNPVCVSQQEFLHTTKLMFGGTPPYIPHPPTQEDLRSEIFLSTTTLAQ
ncbi:hypothetical protein O181_064436 [Austropuccinia psidii MF-1]|uniref:Uncharacterized protein n=1 Tax=Austropuccinia psidii MF-1 TaxID=1389203 RepID=A0A9Q3ETN9_9BASI|nr:hypothetical protein [Austropuccinia psidii MF-1]